VSRLQRLVLWLWRSALYRPSSPVGASVVWATRGFGPATTSSVAGVLSRPLGSVTVSVTV